MYIGSDSLGEKQPESRLSRAATGGRLFWFLDAKKPEVTLRLIQGKTMETNKSASRQHGKTVRILTDFPVLVQTKNTLTRKSRSKPVAIMLGQFLITLSVTDSGEPVLKIDEPP